MNCLIVGTGGVGGSIAAFLALAGHTVTCIARGEHLANMLSKGLQLHSGLKGEVNIPCAPYATERVATYAPTQGEGVQLFACTTEQYTGKADLIFVTVKGYSIDSVAPCIMHAARPDTIVLPVLNVYGTGPRIARACPGVRVIDGCIYIVGFVNAPGEVTQMGTVFKLVFGARAGDGVQLPELEQVRDVLDGAGIRAVLSDDINRDTFAKWGFISAMACTGAYFDVPMGALQQPGEPRDVFVGLTRESSALAAKLGIVFDYDPVVQNLRIIDALAPESTASMQKDMARGHESEIQGQLFDVLLACEAQGIDAPTYRKVAAKFRPMMGA